MQFHETYNCLASQLNYRGRDLSYKKWLSKDEDLKSSYLFVNFYDAVSNAWRRKSTFTFIDEAEAVSLVLQYLQKNVSKIKSDSKRYTSSYIYTVCFNCMAILHWRKCDRTRAQLETSLTVTHNGEEFDLLQVVSSTTVEEFDVTDQLSSNLFDVVALMGVEYENLAYHLVSPDISLNRTSSRGKDRNTNPFADVRVSKKNVQQMTEQIKRRIASYMIHNRPDLVEYLKGCDIDPEVEIVS